MRLQTMTLPNPDEQGRCPWVLVVDNFPHSPASQLAEEIQHAAMQLGAKGVLIFPYSVEVV